MPRNATLSHRISSPVRGGPIGEADSEVRLTPKVSSEDDAL